MNDLRLYLKKISKFLFNRIMYVIVAIVTQVAWVVVQFVRLAGYSTYIQIALTVISIIVVLFVINQDINPSYKLLWTFLILALPIFGLVFFLLVGETRRTSSVDRRYNRVVKKEPVIFNEDEGARKRLETLDPGAFRQSAYIRNATGSPLMQSTQARYFASGEDLLPVMQEEIGKAKHYIFIEFFIIRDGFMWESILKVLEKKAREGVDVRIIYDDFGCMTTLPVRYYETLRQKGIRCEVFNRFHFLANIVHNNRDHRKLCIIDGHTGITGGINLSDEYINQDRRFGHWKDTALLLKGDAVWNLTVMFLQMWNVVTKTDDDIPYGEYLPDRYLSRPFDSEGFFQPFADSPLDKEAVGANVYLNILAQARKYVYIYTPYLIVDSEMRNALCLAAKSGVDVRIITPGIPDKKLVFLLTQSYFGNLVKAGVKIYKYKPGFLHAKSFVCDDRIAVCGTINLDYRSLYLHFEDGVWIYGSHIVSDIKLDFEETLSLCQEVTLQECLGKKLPVRALQSVFRVLAPLV